MTGLLANLLDVALGRAVVATPRPNARFEQSGMALQGIEWRQQISDASETVEDTSSLVAPTAPVTPDVAPLAERRTATPAATPAAVRTAPHVDSVAAAAPLLPPAAVVQEQSRSSPAYSERHDDSGRGIQQESRILLRAAGDIPASQDEPPPFAPLLPMLQEPAVNGEAAVSLMDAPPGAGETIVRGEGGFTLRIGRIEVRPLAEKPAVHRPATTSFTRPVVLPRASVRQSLDDYRAGRKR